MYIDTKTQGTLNNFVCDFVQDELGCFYFVKIHEFETDGKPVNNNDWVLSTEIDKEKKE